LIKFKIQNLYGQWIRNNTGDKQAMKDSIWAIYHHMIREDGISLEKQHDKCPKGPDSWCKFWSDRSSYNESKRLPSVFINEMEKNIQ